MTWQTQMSNRLMASASERMEGAAIRELGRGRFHEGGTTIVPLEIGVKPGDRLLAVRGSRYGLGFIAQGPIYEEALNHPEVQAFENK